MHKLLEYVCDELDELERKAEKQGKLSMQEIQYMDTLAHAKKNLLTADAMMESDYSMDDGMSMARGRGRNAKRDSMGRYSSRGSYDGTYGGSYDNSMARGRSNRGYSRDAEELVTQLRDLEMNAQDEETRRMIQKFIKQAEM